MKLRVAILGGGLTLRADSLSRSGSFLRRDGLLPAESRCRPCPWGFHLLGSSLPDSLPYQLWSFLRQPPQFRKPAPFGLNECVCLSSIGSACRTMIDLLRTLTTKGFRKQGQRKLGLWTKLYFPNSRQWMTDYLGR